MTPFGLLAPMFFDLGPCAELFAVSGRWLQSDPGLYTQAALALLCQLAGVILIARQLVDTNRYDSRIREILHHFELKDRSGVEILKLLSVLGQSSANLRIQLINSQIAGLELMQSLDRAHPRGRNSWLGISLLLLGIVLSGSTTLFSI
ncbi:Uncharacterised protein [Mycobacteroides abscessus subsp. abscessus]|uniref:hypothetical protein n=1 Tax=Mycobacteroides abscessus TaxID=36809 RepID=UPI000925BE94|nr:hypothetical protein [Mycobacteroides abscessus]SIK88050.1 Uncharacterised protein [Mycobacteroides abscessus subsp. abscessus]SLE22570.1 Uncharacterised protein [Mycobacteroides abscessus subsp. abscessus]